MTDTTNSPPSTTERWAEGAVVYQIYPRSFQDSNGDGVGDLPGVISRLDYLAELGVTAVWLSPFYPSPMADFGYDVSDYTNVAPMFGTLQDFDELLSGCHDRNIKVIVDLVPNHTSDEHPWFQESRRSRDNPKTDWYVWQNPSPESPANQPQPPNNWRNVFDGQSAWEWDETRQQYYLHSFHKKQPDLNWSHREVREAIKDVIRFWLKRGVDGFRVDAVFWMAKEPLLSDDPPNPDYDPAEDTPYDALLHTNSQGWPVLYAYLAEMARVLEEPDFASQKRFMVTEAYPETHNPVASYMEFYVGMDPAVAAPFNFEGLILPWQAAAWRRFLKPFHKALEQFNRHCIASYAFGNHDHSRLASRLGERAARSAACLQLSLPGMIFIYYGEELGLHDVPISPDEVRDPAAQGGGGRDPERTPMQWSGEPLAGFSTTEPWLPLAPDYATHNVASEQVAEGSTWQLYRQLIALRNSEPALRLGELEVLDLHAADVLAFRRTHPGSPSYVTLINFSTLPVTVTMPFPLNERIISSLKTPHIPESGSEIFLSAQEAAIYRCDTVDTSA